MPQVEAYLMGLTAEKGFKEIEPHKAPNPRPHPHPHPHPHPNPNRNPNPHPNPNPSPNPSSNPSPSPSPNPNPNKARLHELLEQLLPAAIEFTRKKTKEYLVTVDNNLAKSTLNMLHQFWTQFLPIDGAYEVPEELTLTLNPNPDPNPNPKPKPKP